MSAGRMAMSVGALLVIAAGITYCSVGRDTVPFAFVDERQAVLHQGHLNTRTGQADIAVGAIRYSGVFPFQYLDHGWTHATTRLLADNGPPLACDIEVRSDGFGKGQCRGDGTPVYQIALRPTLRF